MVSKRNQLLYHFSILIHLHLARFTHKILLKTLNREILAKQLIEFQLRGPGPRAWYVMKWKMECNGTEISV